MSKIKMTFIMMLISTSNTFSQQIVSTVMVEKLEKKAISKMQKTFKIPKKTQLLATTVFEIGDTTVGFAEYPNFETNNKIENYLQKSRIIRYEIFVYDSELKNVYVVNRIFFGSGKFSKELYLGKKDDFIIANFFFENKYDYVLDIINTFPLSRNYEYIFLCFKQDKIYLAYLKDGDVKWTPVSYCDNFNFLNNATD